MAFWVGAATATLGLHRTHAGARVQKSPLEGDSWQALPVLNIELMISWITGIADQHIDAAKLFDSLCDTRVNDAHGVPPALSPLPVRSSATAWPPSILRSAMSPEASSRTNPRAISLPRRFQIAR